MKKTVVGGIVGLFAALALTWGALEANAEDYDDDGLAPEPVGQDENLAPNEPKPPAEVYYGPHQMVELE